MYVGDQAVPLNKTALQFRARHVSRSPLSPPLSPHSLSISGGRSARAPALPRRPDRGWLCVQGCYNIDSDLGGRDAALMLDEAGYREAIALCAEVPPHPTFPALSG